jgi:hypothetical protein
MVIVRERLETVRDIVLVRLEDETPRGSRGHPTGCRRKKDGSCREAGGTLDCNGP